MNDIVLLLSSIGGMFIILGGGVKWLLSHIDAKTLAAQKVELDARTQLSNGLNDDIRKLREVVDMMQKRESIYVRRIYQLEGFIHTQPGITIPTMEGWPP